MKKTLHVVAMLLLFSTLSFSCVSQIIITIDTLDFQVQTPNTIQALTTKIQNVGTTAIPIIHLELSGSSDFAFSTSFIWPTVIQPGQSHNVNVYFGSHNVGEHIGQIDVYHTDSSTPVEVIYLHGITEDPNCAPYGTACDDGDGQTINDIENGLCECIGTPCPECINGILPPLTSTIVKLKLEGFYVHNNNKMRTNLNYFGLLPLQQPFNRVPYNYAGDESVTAFSISVVDWVLLTAHDSQGNILKQQACLLRNDGKITSTDGSEHIYWYLNEPYYISVQHQSHLGVISADLSFEMGKIIDFTDANSSHAQGQLKVVNGTPLLFAGDFDSNGIINNLDYNIWIQDNALFNQYVSWDADGNGIVNNLDFNFWDANKSKVGSDFINVGSSN